MTALSEAVDALYAALATVDGVRAYRGTGVRLDPPAAVVGPPRIARDAFSPDPTEATFQIAVVVAWSEYSMDELMRLEQPVVTALWDLTEGAVQSPSNPGTWNAGGVDLPAYLIDVVFPL